MLFGAGVEWVERLPLPIINTVIIGQSEVGIAEEYDRLWAG